MLFEIRTASSHSWYRKPYSKAIGTQLGERRTGTLFQNCGRPNIDELIPDDATDIAWAETESGARFTRFTYQPYRWHVDIQSPQDILDIIAEVQYDVLINDCQTIIIHDAYIE